MNAKRVPGRSTPRSPDENDDLHRTQTRNGRIFSPNLQTVSSGLGSIRRNNISGTVLRNGVWAPFR
jgi:hypothetical protein